MSARPGPIAIRPARPRRAASSSPKQYTGWADTHIVKGQTVTNAVNPATTPTGVVQPLVIADFGSGTFSMNYRNEPLPLRLNNTDPQGSDAAWAYASIKGRTGGFSTQPVPGGLINPGCKDGVYCFNYPQAAISDGMKPEDPYTPLLRAYPQDPVQIRLLAGGFTTMHDVITHGLPWKFEPYNPNSGWRESQLTLLSEHFELHVKPPRAGDYLYSTSASYEGMTNGLWGLLRTYPFDEKQVQQRQLVPLPSNPKPADLLFTPPSLPPCPSDSGTASGPCVRTFDVTALTIAQALGKDAALTYNDRGLTLTTGFARNEILNDPMAIIYVRSDDLCTPPTDCIATDAMLKRNAKVEPLVLRVAAGDVVKVNLTNAVDVNAATFTTPISGARPGIPYSTPYGSINLLPSKNVGLHPQLLAFDVKTDNGINVGDNPASTAPPTGKWTYTWYAGTMEAGPDNTTKATPVEFGALNLMPADPLNHPYRGLFGGLVVEPAGSTWKEDPDSHMSATVHPAGRPTLPRVRGHRPERCRHSAERQLELCGRQRLVGGELPNRAGNLSLRRIACPQRAGNHRDRGLEQFDRQ